jgi:hypothetical protein
MLEIKRKAHEQFEKKVNNNDDSNIKREYGFGSNIMSSMQVQNWKNDLTLYFAWAKIKGFLMASMIFCHE